MFDLGFVIPLLQIEESRSDIAKGQDTPCGLLSLYILKGCLVYKSQICQSGVLDVIHTFPLVLLSFKSEICHKDVRSVLDVTS